MGCGRSHCDSHYLPLTTAHPRHPRTKEYVSHASRHLPPRPPCATAAAHPRRTTVLCLAVCLPLRLSAAEGMMGRVRSSSVLRPWMSSCTHACRRRAAPMSTKYTCRPPSHTPSAPPRPRRGLPAAPLRTITLCLLARLDAAAAAAAAATPRAAPSLACHLLRGRTCALRLSFCPCLARCPPSACDQHVAHDGGEGKCQNHAGLAVFACCS